MSTASAELSKVHEIIEKGMLEECIKQDVHRADFLPWLFRLRGEKFSLVDYPQFKEMYASVYVPDTIFMCGRQIGKTLNLSRSEILDMLFVPHMQLLYVAPLQSQTQRYSTLYLNEAIASCHYASYLQEEANTRLSDAKIIKSVHHQAFANGAGIQLTYAKTSSDRARGIFADRIDFDEIQDQLTDNIPIISESLTASNWGIRRFTGTAKTTDNTIEALWQDSAMCEWVMKCSGCNHWNFPTVEGKVLDMVQADGLHCVKCGKLLNVRDGQFVPAFPDRMEAFRGYHIPQVVVPAIVENPQKWDAIVRKMLKLPLPIIMQEIMGISCSIGARIITQADIDRQSTLDSVERLQKRRKDYIFTVGGVDWGIAEHDSFTVHTILGVRPDGQMHVLWARRFSGFDPDEVLKEIAQAHRFYNCRMLAADFGMGFDKNVMLEKRFNLPVVQIQYCRQNRLLQYNPILGHHRWTVDKTTALELLFLAIKYGRIHFPPKEEFEIYTADLLSPYEEVVESAGLVSRRFLRNPNRPDDFAHALCFSSMLAMRLLNSNIDNIVPAHALGAQSMPGVDSPPTLDNVDPQDILSAVT
jgi:hypothetical protein